MFKDPLSRNGNYLLTISVVEDIRKECKNSRIIYDEQAYLGEKKYKLCCEWAIQDIPILAKYIDDFFLIICKEYILEKIKLIFRCPKGRKN